MRKKTYFIWIDLAIIALHLFFGSVFSLLALCMFFILY